MFPAIIVQEPPPRAGIQRIPVIVDTKPMTRSTITAKQIAANELTGHADENLLAQLVTQMDNVDDLLLSDSIRTACRTSNRSKSI